MEHEWRGDVTRAGDGDANVIFVFFRFLVFFLVGYYTILNKFSGEGKRPDLHSQNYSGPDNVCKNRSRCSPVLKRITGP